MKISLSTLEIVSQKIFLHLKNQNIESLEITEDFYWDIDSEERYNPYKDPQDLTLGQLSDDWEEIQKIFNEEIDPNAYALVWLAALYKIIGEKIPY